MRRRAGLALALTLMLPAAACAIFSQAAWAQHPDVEVGPVAPGEGNLRGRVEGEPGAPSIANLDVVLYSLPADATPGVARTTTDADGRFGFEGISNDPRTVYLVGVRAGGIPYGQRVVFEPDRREAFVRIAISAADPDPSHVELGSTFVRIDRGCSALRVNESHELHNPGREVVFVPPEAREQSQPIFEAELPAEATDFATPLGVVPEGLERDGRQLRFWGPVHPGRQELEYGYLLPGGGAPNAAGVNPAAGDEGAAGADPAAGDEGAAGADPAAGDEVAAGIPGGAEVHASWRYPRGAQRVVFLTDAQGPEVGGASIERDSVDDRSVDGRAYRAWVAANAADGAPLEVTVSVPPAPAAPISLRRSAMWLELDGAALVAEEHHVLQVDGSAPLEAKTDAPLLCLPLPAGAEGLRFSQATLDMGLGADASGALAIRGPIPPGESALALRYRVAAGPGEVDFRRSFPFELPLFTLFVADTGVQVETQRLHRLQTLRTEDRTYLHFEGFAIEPDETLDLRLVPLPVTRPLPGVARAGFAAVVALAAIGFLAAPLRGRSEAAPAGETAADRLAGERDAVYAAIRDLDEDFETGKLTAADHASMRDELRQRALELAQSERDAQRGGPPQPEGAAAATPAPTPTRCAACEAPLPEAARFCPQCGARLGDTAG